MSERLTSMDGKSESTIKPAHDRSLVPIAVRRYLAHTVEGLSIREIARDALCHPSTVLRQVRKVELLRDDPFFDEALSRLTYHLSTFSLAREDHRMSDTEMADPEARDREAIRVLRRLCETGAVLAVAADMDKAVVVRESDGQTTRTAAVAREVAQDFVLREWVHCSKPARLSRYRITAKGRKDLNRLLAEQANRAQGFAEAQAGFDHGGANVVPGPRAMRVMPSETPLAALARRRDKTGAPFLAHGLVAAGERLREDFELAQMGPRKSANWARFLNGEDPAGYVTDAGVSGASARARERVVQAMADLGEGLADVTLHCCCFLEGLETAEKRLGWSARSGKIVLRIALTRLSEFYRSQSGSASHMIG